MATEADVAAFEGLQKIIETLTPQTHGRWANEEHTLFLHCLRVYGKDWNKCATILKSRSVIQVRTHAQKYFQKVAKETGDGKLPESSSCTSSTPRKMRMCRRCRGHGALVPLQGHASCPHTGCTCSRCVTNKGTKRNTRNDTAYEGAGSGPRFVPEEDAVTASQILLGAKGGRAHGNVAAKNGHGGGPWQGSMYASSSSSSASSGQYGDPSRSSQSRPTHGPQHGFSAMASAASAMVRNISGAGVDEMFGAGANASQVFAAMSAVAGSMGGGSNAQYGERHGQDHGQGQGQGGGQQASKRHKAAGAGTVASQQTGGAAGGLHGVGAGGARQKMPRFGSL